MNDATAELIDLVRKARREGWYEDNSNWDRVDELLAMQPTICTICKGYGRYQDGHSGRESDGYAPNIVECDCSDEERCVRATDEQIIARLKAKGIDWSPGGRCDNGLYSIGSFERTTMSEMRTVLGITNVSLPLVPPAELLQKMHLEYWNDLPDSPNIYLMWQNGETQQAWQKVWEAILQNLD